MRERPILFNGPMVRAILSGHKTQTRRVMKPQPVSDTRFRSGFRVGGRGSTDHRQVSTDASAALLGEVCPFGQPGDRLWVRETWCHAWDDQRDQWSDPERYHYRADGVEVQDVDGDGPARWTPSIHMPRRACRLVLEITAVRVERLMDISHADALAEGIHAYPHVWRDCEYPLPDVAYEPYPGSKHRYSSPVAAFGALWIDTGGDGDSNPWVWVIEFNRINEVSNG